jgi:multicomponent Na+:H+ antiporter subunit C
MTTLTIYAFTSIILFSIGLFGLVSHLNLIRKIVSLNIMAGGTFLFLISLAYHGRSFDIDPVPQAMVLTGIVVTISATAFALCLARRIREKTGHCRLEHDLEMEE